jgi:hypothetical protein
MGRAKLTVLILAALLDVGGLAQSPPNAGSAVRSNLLTEWRDLKLYPDLDLKTGKPSASQATGVMHCLTALELYTRSGPSDRKYHADLAFQELVLGNQPAASLYLAVPEGDMLGLLVPKEIAISKDNKLLDLFGKANNAIAAASKKDPLGFKRDVIQPLGANDLRRALYGLLNTQAGALRDFATATVNANQAKKDLQEPRDMEAVKSREAAEAKADAAAKQKELEPYFKRVIEAEEQKKETGEKEKVAKDEAARKAAKTELGNAVANLEKLKNDPKFLQLQKDLGAAHDREEKTKQALDTARATVASAERNARDREAELDTARTGAEDARDLMEVYRICYAIDAKELFKLIS